MHPVRTLQAISVCAALFAPADVGAQRTTWDSAGVDRAARKMQADFEVRRRGFLPLAFSRPNEASCEVTIGRYCYWYADLVVRPPEPPKLRAMRFQFLGYLDNAAARFPGNDWVNGQRVRYRIEAEDYEEAVSAARSCRGTPSWCSALAGLALHAWGKYAESEQAFDLALEKMPEKARCEFRSLSPLLEGPLAKAYGESDCKQRAAIERRVWWLADPMYSIPGNDRRTEHLSRKVMDVVYGQSRMPNGNSWGPDASEIMLRYGFYVFWTREPPSPGSNQSLPTITDHQATPSFHFLPEVTDPDSLEMPGAIKWNFDSFRVRERYAPGYAKNFLPMDPQIVRFVRGDSALLVSAFDVSGDTAFRTPRIRAALAASRLDGVAALTMRPGAAKHDTISLTTGPGLYLAGVEILSPDSLAAGRSRAAVSLPPINHALVSLSGILLFSAEDSLAGNLGEAMSRMLTSNRVENSRKIGLYWEIYDLNSTREALPVTLTLTRQRGNALERLRENLGLSDRLTPISIRWSEPPSNLSIAPRSLLLDLSLVPRGKYDLRIALGDEKRPLAFTQRSMEIR